MPPKKDELQAFLDEPEGTEMALIPPEENEEPQQAEVQPQSAQNTGPNPGSINNVNSEASSERESHVQRPSNASQNNSGQNAEPQPGQGVQPPPQAVPAEQPQQAPASDGINHNVFGTDEIGDREVVLFRRLQNAIVNKNGPLTPIGQANLRKLFSQHLNALKVIDKRSKEMQQQDPNQKFSLGDPMLAGDLLSYQLVTDILTDTMISKYPPSMVSQFEASGAQTFQELNTRPDFADTIMQGVQNSKTASEMAAAECPPGEANQLFGEASLNAYTLSTASEFLENKRETEQERAAAAETPAENQQAEEQPPEEQKETKPEEKKPEEEKKDPEKEEAAKAKKKSGSLALLSDKELDDLIHEQEQKREEFEQPPVKPNAVVGLLDRMMRVFGLHIPSASAYDDYRKGKWQKPHYNTDRLEELQRERNSRTAAKTKMDEAPKPENETIAELQKKIEALNSEIAELKKQKAGPEAAKTDEPEQHAEERAPEERTAEAQSGRPPEAAEHPQVIESTSEQLNNAPVSEQPQVSEPISEQRTNPPVAEQPQVSEQSREQPNAAQQPPANEAPKVNEPNAPQQPQTEPPKTQTNQNEPKPQQPTSQRTKDEMLQAVKNGLGEAYNNPVVRDNVDRLITNGLKVQEQLSAASNSIQLGAHGVGAIMAMNDLQHQVSTGKFDMDLLTKPGGAASLQDRYAATSAARYLGENATNAETLKSRLLKQDAVSDLRERAVEDYRRQAAATLRKEKAASLSNGDLSVGKFNTVSKDGMGIVAKEGVDPKAAKQERLEMAKTVLKKSPELQEKYPEVSKKVAEQSKKSYNKSYEIKNPAHNRPKPHAPAHVGH